MSSDFLSRPVDVKNFDFIYAGVQKNVGPAGVVVAIIKDDLLKKVCRDLPLMLQYKNYVDHDSTYNTPPVVQHLISSIKWPTGSTITADWLPCMNEIRRKRLSSTVSSMTATASTAAMPT